MPTITIDRLQDWLANGKPVTILDIRPEAEAQQWAIPGSVNAPVYAALKSGDPHAMDTVTLPTDRPVVTVCGAGRTAALAEHALRGRGLEAYTLEGGMQSWSLAVSEAEPIRLADGTTIIQVRRIGKGCLSYVIGCSDEAAIIDPALHPDVYLDVASRNNWRITAVMDTHIHADHLSRARLLAERAGATLYLPEQNRARFLFEPIYEGSVIHLDTARIRVISTPGHTWESVCYRLNESALFTGDTLFLDSVGRPDLKADAEESVRRATTLYASLSRLKSLPPDTLILPGHTATPLIASDSPVSAPLGEVLARVTLLDATEPHFVEEVLRRIPPTPPNYEQIVRHNEQGSMPAEPVELEAGGNRCAVG